MAAMGSTAGGGAGEIMLFGVRVVVDSMRKSVSLNNLSQYEHPQELNNPLNSDDRIKDANNSSKEDVVTAGYASADDAVPHSSGSRSERKRGVPWTEDEHKLFLLGLQKVGKGDWRGISRNFVKTRTPTQVASHAQKYFLRRSNLNRRRRRSSLFDITTDTVAAFSMEEEQSHHHDKNKNNASQSHPPMTETSNFPVMAAFPMTTTSPLVLPVAVENPMANMSLIQGNPSTNPPINLIRPIAVRSDINLNLNSSVDSSSALSLKLSLPSDQRESPSRYSAFQVMSCSFSNGDSMISVA
ncbi:transcription factor MYB1R1 [Euphorbia lathyris]|uniref:transcription factor MYB1R1 n=1 Tax=Euphorbia lathyris TaxID=212925 RepID=UPI003313E580